MLGSRRPVIATLHACLVSLVLIAPSAARADHCTTPIYSTCINDDNLWPHAGASHFMTVGGTETTARGELGFGIYTSYLSRPIVLQTNSGGAQANDYAIDDQVNGTFMFAYGVGDRLELDAIVPVTFSQTGTGGTSLSGSSTGLSSSGVRDVRFGFTYALVPRKRVDPEAYRTTSAPRPNLFGLAARLELSAPTGDTDGFGSDGYVVWSPSLAADVRTGPVFAGAELGLRLRPTQEIAGARVGSQAFLGLGAGFDLLPKELLSVTAEAYALPTFSEQHSLETPTGQVGLVSVPNGQYIAPAEWALSLRSAPLFGGDLQIQAGGGGSIPFSSEAPITNPRFRFSLSVRFAPLGRDTDGDGVLDKDDKCPLVAGIKTNPAGAGCPPVIEHEQVDLTGIPPASTQPSPQPPQGSPP